MPRSKPALIGLIASVVLIASPLVAWGRLKLDDGGTHPDYSWVYGSRLSGLPLVWVCGIAGVTAVFKRHARTLLAAGIVASIAVILECVLLFSNQVRDRTLPTLVVRINREVMPDISPGWPIAIVIAASLAVTWSGIAATRREVPS